MRSLTEQLSDIQYRVALALNTVSETPTIDAIAELVSACETIDQEYYALCQLTDRDDGLALGTSYEQGVNLEFYIEGLWWHDISKALRKLRTQDRSSA